MIFDTTPSMGIALVLTNFHVIEGGSWITVRVNDASTYTGLLLGYDIVRDLAVIRICCNATFVALSFADTSTIEPGDEVLAIGYALGIEGPATVTKGIVSAVRYEGEYDRWVVQTDAPINPGNSGGPLLSLEGEILGLITFAYRVTATGVPIEGFGFAISVVTLTTAVPTLAARAPAIIPTPISPTEAPGGIYTNNSYWYTIEVPSGWELSVDTEEAIAIWDRRTGATVWVQAREIDPSIYPTLDSYLAAWEPAPGRGMTDFRIVAQRRIRTDVPVEAHEFSITYVYEDAAHAAIDHWYVVGRYQIKLEASTEATMWASAVGGTLNGVLDSFEPSSYVSAAHDYSLAHPPSWEQLAAARSDYLAEDPISGSGVVVSIGSRIGYTDMGSYGAAHVVNDPEGNLATEFSRQLVFTSRPNPAYRIDYGWTHSNGRQVRGAALITFSGSNAIWVFVRGWAEDWPNLQAVANEVFLRVAVSQ